MIKLSPILAGDLATGRLPVAVFAFDDAGAAGARHLSPSARKELLDLARAEGWKAGAGECVVVSWGGRRDVLVGLGKKKGAGSERFRRAAGALARFSRERFEAVAVAAGEHAAAVAEGLLLGSYRFDEDKSKAEPAKHSAARLIVAGAGERGAAERLIARAELACEAVCFTRDLVNRAPSDKTPQKIAELAKKLDGVKVEVLGAARARELGMGSFLSVARGSTVEPALVHMVYRPPKGAKAARRVALVGKGITFDSGGLSLKPPQAMETMKMDMAGAASVLAVFKILPRLKVRAEVHGVMALTYNMPGPDATKPGDVVRAMNGKTIEILNTDAEGRLVLADALCYAVTQEPDAVVDLATLTGAVVTGLGSKVSGVMSNNRALMGQLQGAAARADEPLCELPLVEDYREHIKSGLADIQNIGKPRGEAGPIIGGLFLEEFVSGRPWAHMDIAGTAWTDGQAPYCPAGGTGTPVRTLIEYLTAL